MRPNRWQQGAKGFMVQNLPLIFFVLLIFVVGVVFGALAIRTLDYSEKEELLGHLSTFFNGLAGKFSQIYDVNAEETIWLNIKTVAIIWLLGISIIGMPVVPVIVFLRGFVIGFTVGFLFNELSFKGLIFALVSILPQNLLIVPAVIFAGMLAMSFSVALLKSLVTKRPMDFGTHLAHYSILMVLIGIVLVLASLIEAFITPVLMKFAARLLLQK